MQLFAEKGDFSNNKRPKRDPKSCLGLLRDPGLPKRDPVGKAIKFPTKHNEVISTMCHCVRLALLIPKLYLFSFLDLAKLCR